MSKPFCVSPDQCVIVVVLAEGVRVGNRGKRFLPCRGLFGPLHAVRHEVAADLVRKGLANCATPLLRLEALAAHHADESHHDEAKHMARLAERIGRVSSPDSDVRTDAWSAA